MSVDWVALQRSLERARDIPKKVSDWSGTQRLVEQSRVEYEEQAGKERPLKLADEIESHVNRELFEEFAFRAMEMAVVGRGSYSEKTNTYWNDAYVKRLTYYGPPLSSYPSVTTKKGSVESFMEYPSLDMCVKIGASHYAKYEVVASPFTVQHYFKTESMAKCFMENVANLLVEGGKFICMYHSGSAIVDLVESRGGTLGIYHSENGEFSVEREWKGVGRFFGSSYTMIPSDSVREGESWLVFTNVLLELARKAGLSPIKQMPDEAMLYMRENENKKYPTFYYDCYEPNNTFGKLKNIVVFEKSKK